MFQQPIAAWTTTDKLAAFALAVAIASFLVSLIPAITSIVQAWVAYLAYRRDRETREPAVNVSSLVPTHWPQGYIQLALTVQNRSDFFIEVRRVRLKSPRAIGIAAIPLEIPFMPPRPPVEPTALNYSRHVDLGDTLVRPAGAKLLNPSQPGATEIPGDRQDFRLALRVPEHMRHRLLLKIRVDIARSNRHIRSTVIPVHFDLLGWEWRAVRD